jgi:serine/threonine protein kinase
MEPGLVLVDRYRVEKIIGRGGMGLVCLATKLASGQARAIKQLVTHTPDAAATRQFAREAEILAQVEHPGLVRMRDFFVDQDHHYIVMDYVEGENLGEYLRAKKPIDLRQALDWSWQLCSVLEALHEHRPPIIFRDLKPSNIMIDPHLHIRLIDFGIARLLEEGSETTTFLKGVGSTGFAPLEQYGGEGGTDERSDIYSLGATMYALLTGRVPESPVNRVAEGKTLVSPRQFKPEIPRPIEAIVLRMLALKKESRYRTVREVRLALERFARDGSSDPTPAQDEEVAFAPTFTPAAVPIVEVRSTQMMPAPESTQDQQANRSFDQFFLFSWASMALVTMLYWANGAHSGPMTLFSVPFRVAGGILFSLGGELQAAWGANLFQLAFPLYLSISLAWRFAKPKLACLCLWWFFLLLFNHAHAIKHARLAVYTFPGEEQNAYNTILGHHHLLLQSESLSLPILWLARLGSLACMGWLLWSQFGTSPGSRQRDFSASVTPQ